MILPSYSRMSIMAMDINIIIIIIIIIYKVRGKRFC